MGMEGVRADALGFALGRGTGQCSHYPWLPGRQSESWPHLPRGPDSLPNAEEADQPDEEKAEREVPFQSARVVDPRGQA